jgi:hypothetical protein
LEYDFFAFCGTRQFSAFMLIHNTHRNSQLLRQIVAQIK